MLHLPSDHRDALMATQGAICPRDNIADPPLTMPHKWVIYGPASNTARTNTRRNQMLNLAKLNGITATIVACVNCGLTADHIAAKLASKYGVSESAALALVNAVAGLV